MMMVMMFYVATYHHPSRSGTISLALRGRDLKSGDVLVAFVLQVYIGDGYHLPLVDKTSFASLYN